MTNTPQFFQEVRESILEAIKDRRIGTLIDGEKGKVFVDTDDTLEKERMINIFLSKFEAHLLEQEQDINSVLAMLDGNTDRVKIANYVRKYLLPLKN